MTNSQVRLIYPEPEVCQRSLAIYENSVAEIQQELQIPNNHTQTRYSLLERATNFITLYGYYFGAPLAEIKAGFHRAAQLFSEVIRLRGTEAPIPTYELTYDAQADPNEDGSGAQITPLTSPEDRDYSLTNSRDTFLAVCHALIGGDMPLAQQLAAAIWDPPDPCYVGQHDYCTANDQHLAYAVRAYMQQDHAEAARELKKIRMRPKELRVAFESALLDCILRNSTTEFIESLAGLLRTHEKTAKSSRYRTDSDYFLAQSGLGFCILAINAGVCQLADLPQDNPFLPIELLALSVG